MKKRYGWVLSLITVYLLLVFLLSVIEGGQPAAAADSQIGTTIHTFSDALWYSLITISTVGYGDMTPVTPGGRLIGIVFVLCSAGVLAALISLGLRLIGGTLIPRMRLRFERRRNWYVFSDCSADSYTLAEALSGNMPDCILIFPAGEPGSFETGNIVRIPIDTAKLIRLRKSTQGMYYFAMSGDPWRNYTVSADAAARGVRSYCMGNIHPESVPETLQLFSLTEAMSRHYWETHPLLASERCVVLIGFGEAGLALLERALLNNVFITERGIEYHLFGNGQLFSDLHPEIIKALGGSSAGSARLILHEESWTSARELLLRADRILLCEDEDGRNLASFELLKSWYVSGAAIHIRLDTAIPGFTCFGDKKEILTPKYVMQDELNRRAILMNDIYNENAPNPTAWRDLSPFLQASNIAAADHLPVKARCLLHDETLTELTGEDCAKAYTRYRELNPEMADCFQEMEHRRWMRFYQMYNWQYAPKRDNDLRHHPLLVPYAQLSAGDRVKDAFAWEMLGKLAEKAHENEGRKS